MDNSNSNPTVEKTSKELRDEKSRDLKLEEQVLKTLGPTATIEEKFNVLLKKFIENEKTCKKLNSTIKLNEKKYDTLLREKDILQKEYNKGVLMKDKLEQVCREQQKLIKSVKNESLTKIREEEEKRKESQARFQVSINEISATLNKNNEENTKLKEDNIEMTKKLKYLAEQYQAREKQLQKISEQIQLESQLHEAKLAKFQMEAAIEKESLLRDKQNALDELLTCKRVIQEMQNQEECLKEQLKIYTTKYDDFQNSLQKSNDIFVSYKAELEKMYKNTRKLEKECVEWKKKWEKSNASLIQLATENQEKDEHLTKITRQLSQLQKLLRALQAERNCLYQVLKDNNIERPPIPVLPEEPEITISPHQNKSSDKMEQMAKNCAELKQTLSKLQNQVEAITNKQTTLEVQSSSSLDSNTNKKGKSSKKSKTKGSTKTNSAKESSLSSSSSPSTAVVVEKQIQITTNSDQVLLTNDETSSPAAITNENHTENPLNLASNDDVTEMTTNQCDDDKTNALFATKENLCLDKKDEVVSTISPTELLSPSTSQQQNELNSQIEPNTIEIDNNPQINGNQIDENLGINEETTDQPEIECNAVKEDISMRTTNEIATDFNKKCEINEKLCDDIPISGLLSSSTINVTTDNLL